MHRQNFCGGITTLCVWPARAIHRVVCTLLLLVLFTTGGVYMCMHCSFVLLFMNSKKFSRHKKLAKQSKISMRRDEGRDIFDLSPFNFSLVFSKTPLFLDVLVCLNLLYVQIDNQRQLWDFLGRDPPPYSQQRPCGSLYMN